MFIHISILFEDKHERIMKDKFAIGVDVGGSHVCSAVVDIEDGSICSEPVTTPVDSSAGAVEVVNAWAENVRRSMSGFGGKVSRVGFAFPGPFDYVRGISLISGVGKYESVYGLNVAETMRSVLFSEAGDVQMRFVNDASAFALGEALYGAAADSSKVLALTLGTGVGSGFVADGKLVTSGEGVPDNGWVYCLPFEDGIADEAFSTRWIVKRYLELTGLQVEGAREVAERYDTDESARVLFREYGERLAAFAGPVLSKFGGRALVIGGNISRAYHLFAETLDEGLRTIVPGAEVRVSGLLDKSAMIGAASLFV